MGVKPIQIGLPLQIEGDALASTTTTESPVGKEHLMELILRSENLQRALKRVKQNKGAAGVDQMGTEQLHDHLKQHWALIKQQLLEGTYQPQPVRRVEIPKPNGSKRLLGIPTVLDRFIQQAMLQILQDQWDETFSQFSYGFRPGRSAHQAIRQAQHYVQDGYRWIKRRLRCYLWKQWGRAGYRRLCALGVSRDLAWNTCKSAHGPWRLSRSPALAFALPARYFADLGLPSLLGYQLNQLNRRGT